MHKLAAIDIGSFFGSPFGVNATVGSLVGSVINIVFVIAGIIIMFFFLLGGYQIIAGAGNNNPQDVAKGQQAIRSAIIGFVVIFVAYWIIQIIQALTRTEFITNPGF
jgi:uncharacterized membrane protein